MIDQIWMVFNDTEYKMFDKMYIVWPKKGMA